MDRIARSMHSTKNGKSPSSVAGPLFAGSPGELALDIVAGVEEALFEYGVASIASRRRRKKLIIGHDDGRC